MSNLHACAQAIENRTQRGAILPCGACCAVFIIEDWFFGNSFKNN